MPRGFDPTVVRAFEVAFRPWMRLRIADVRVANVPRSLPPDRPLLLAANHVSWWDGFILRHLQRMVRPAAPLYSVMTRRELRRFPFLGRIGAVGIDPTGAVSIARTVRELERRVAERPDSVIAYFPQGEIGPSFRRPLGFQRGVELFARRLDAVVVPVGLHVEPLAKQAPTIFVSAADPLPTPPSATALEALVEEQLDAIHAFLAAHGERAAEEWSEYPTARTAAAAGEA